MKKNQRERVWVPLSGRNVVARWVWTKQAGLRVEYMDGLKVRSDWRSLREFLKAIKEGREHAVEVKS